MWHRGDVIRARIVPTMRGSVSGSRPVLDLVIGENTRRVEGRSTRTAAAPSSSTRCRAPTQPPRTKSAWPRCRWPASTSTRAVSTPSPMRSTAVPPAFRRSSMPSGSARSSCRAATSTVRGDEIFWFARFHKAVVVSGTPVLMQRIGDEMREARHRPDVQTLAGGMIFTYTVQAGDCDTDGVGILANAIRGGSTCRPTPRHPAGGLRDGAGRSDPGAGPAGVAPAGRRRVSGPAAPPRLNCAGRLSLEAVPPSLPGSSSVAPGIGRMPCSHPRPS